MAVEMRAVEPYNILKISGLLRGIPDELSVWVILGRWVVSVPQRLPNPSHHFAFAALYLDQDCG